MLSSEEYIRNRRNVGYCEARIFYEPELDVVVAASIMGAIIFSQEDLFQLGSLLIHASMSVSDRDIYQINKQQMKDLGLDRDEPRERAEPPRKDRSGFVYLIQSGTGSLYKIGRARDAGIRMAALQKSSPSNLSLLFAIKTSDSLALEKYFHKKHEKCRVKGEWFDLDEYAIAEFMNYEEVA